MTLTKDINTAADIILNGGVIAYPTEAVFGLGCNWQNEAGIKNIIQLKGRPLDKGIICLIANMEQATLLTTLPEKQLANYSEKYWPGPNTLLLPARQEVHTLISGGSGYVAVRLSDFSTCQALTERAGPILSTSCNPHGKEAARDTERVLDYFASELDAVLDLPVQGLKNPSTIINPVTGDRLR